jgi:hypothetical protein
VRTLLVIREPGDLQSDHRVLFGLVARVGKAPNAVADDARPGEVGPRHSSWEAREQRCATASGVGGAKGGDQGEHDQTAHAVDSVPRIDVSQRADRVRGVGGRRACGATSDLR